MSSLILVFWSSGNSAISFASSNDQKISRFSSRTYISLIQELRFNSRSLCSRSNFKCYDKSIHSDMNSCWRALRLWKSTETNALMNEKNFWHPYQWCILLRAVLQSSTIPIKESPPANKQEFISNVPFHSLRFINMNIRCKSDIINKTTAGKLFYSWGIPPYLHNLLNIFHYHA